MTSIEFFRHQSVEPKPPINWGRTEPRHVKEDVTRIQGPTFLTKHQPIDQLYRVSNLQLSDVRAHDQCAPRPFDLNMNDNQVDRPFPMEHPLTSTISRNVVFPNYSAPEDPRLGENGLRSNTEIKSAEAKGQPDPVIVVSKSYGNPWRHEIRHVGLPSQKPGVWWNNQPLYQYAKPDQRQTYYPAPTSILAPNPKLRSLSHSLDPHSWNMLRNKERELLQTTHQIDFYKDGLGTRVAFSTDNLDEKNAEFLKTGRFDESLKPYFKRNAGINNTTTPVFKVDHFSPKAGNNQPPPLTQLEKDNIYMEEGRDYKSFPEAQYSNQFTQNGIFRGPGLLRSNTMPVATTPTQERPPKGKGDKQKREEYFHDQVQKLETENRLKQLEAITPKQDINALRLQYAQLENSRGPRPNLKQNVKQHVNAFYNHEAKYLAERTELYKTSYDPYQLQSSINAVKANPEPTSFEESNKKDAVIPGDSYDHRPKLYAHRVFSEHVNDKRKPLEDSLKYPVQSASAKVQEGNLILKQSTYGDSYNTKKFLQENEFVTNRGTVPTYAPINPADLEFQDIAIKSKVEEVALNDYKAGYTTDPKDYARAGETIEAVNKHNKNVQQTTYPRMAGPYAPEPYEPIYCLDQINEISTGYEKRQTERLYDSPFINEKKPKYKPLDSDLKAIAEAEAKDKQNAEKNAVEAAKAAANTDNNQMQTQTVYTTQDVRAGFTARADDEPLRESFNISNYSKDYRTYHYEHKEKSPPNTYYEKIQYEEAQPPISGEPSSLVSLQDKWSKTDAQQKFLAKYSTPSSDLRDNMRYAKKPIFISPNFARMYFGDKSS